jgi:hypothetical protein
MPTPPIRIMLPNGDVVTSDRPDLNQVLANALGRAGKWATSASENASLEEYWPDIEGLAHRETVTDEAMPPGTFFDMAAVHVLTTATMDHLRKQQPGGRFDARRFRPNIVIQLAAPEEGFPEDAWLGRTLVIGGGVELQITKRCGRCVMTTLPQGDLPSDPSILRTAVKHNQGHVGVYAQVLRGGTVRRGDPIRLA